MLDASIIYALHRPSYCQKRIWLLGRGEEPDPPGPFEQVLFRLGKRHEAGHLASLGPYTDLSGGSLAERKSRTAEAIARGDSILYQPVIIAEIRTADGPERVVGIPDFLIRDDASYRIRDSKLALHADEERHPEILRQLELYGWLYQQVAEIAPSGLDAWLGNSSVAEVPFDFGLQALALLRRIHSLMKLSSEPYSPVGWSKCIGCGFRRRCWAAARAAQDVATIYGVDQGLALALRDAGVKSIKDLLASFSEASLAEFVRPWGNRERKVGGAAWRILAQARAMLDGCEFLLSQPALPTGRNFAMFDLEGMPPHLDEAEKVYLWGMQVFGAQPSPYSAAVAGFEPDGDREGWFEFLRLAASMFDRYGDLPFVHWHHYEATKLRLYVARHGDANGVAARVLANCVDLLPIVRRAVVLPVVSYSLKVVEQHVGFRRQLNEGGGDWAMAKFIEATETRDAATRDTIMADILAYNREDLAATWAVYQWFRSATGGAAN